jgi:hypothetical protein
MDSWRDNRAKEKEDTLTYLCDRKREEECNGAPHMRSLSHLVHGIVSFFPFHLFVVDFFEVVPPYDSETNYKTSTFR